MKTQNILIGQIIPSKTHGGRQFFDKARIEVLSESIKNTGLLQPIVVRQKGERFEIIAGERRFKASKMAGLSEIPCIIKKYDNEGEVFRDGLVENIVREDLTNWELREHVEKLARMLGEPYIIDNHVSPTNITRYILGDAEVAVDDGGRVNSPLRNRINEIMAINERAPAKLKALVDGERLDARTGYSILTIKNKENRQKLIDMADDGVPSGQLRQHASQLRNAQRATELARRHAKLPNYRYEAMAKTLVANLEKQTKTVTTSISYYGEFIDVSKHGFVELALSTKMSVATILEKAVKEIDSVKKKVELLIEELD